MASKGKKIALLDAGGMLSKEALLGYVFNELQPATRDEVEKLLAQNEMYRDMVEGLKHVETRAEAEHILNELNVDVAERSGSTANVPGVGESVGEFFWNYRRVAAVVGTVLIVSAAVLTFGLLQVSGDKEMAMQHETAKVDEKTDQQSAAVNKKEESAALKPTEPQQTEDLAANGSSFDSVANPTGLNLSASGGTAPYSYEWDNSTPSTPSGIGTTSPSAGLANTSNTTTINLNDANLPTGAIMSNQMALPKLTTPPFQGTSGLIGEANNGRADNVDLSAAGSYKYAPVQTDTVRNEDLAVLQSTNTKKAKAEQLNRERDKALADDEKNAVKDVKIPAEAEEETRQEKLAEIQLDQKSIQNTSTTQPGYMSDVPRTTTDQMPVYPGGQEALIKYLHDNLRYPEKSKAEGVQGKVYLSFVIGTGGRVKEIAVLQGVSKELNAEAIRLLANMPKWEPGREKGVPVAVMLYQTVEFKLP